MNQFFGCDEAALLNAYGVLGERWRALDGAAGRDAYAELLREVEAASTFVPLPERVGLLSVEVIADEPDYVEVGIFERRAPGEGLEWSGPVVRWHVDEDGDLGAPLGLWWVADGLGGAEARGACSIVHPAFREALREAQRLVEDLLVRRREDREDAERQG